MALASCQTASASFGTAEHLELSVSNREYLAEQLKPWSTASAQRRQQTPVVSGTAAGATLQPSLYGSQPPMLPGRGGPMPSTRGPPPPESEAPAPEDEMMLPIPEWALEADLELEKSNILLLVSVRRCLLSSLCCSCSSCRAYYCCGLARLSAL